MKSYCNNFLQALNCPFWKCIFRRQFTSWFWRFYDLSNVPPLERAAVGDRRGVLRPGEAQHGGGRVARLDDRADRRRRRGVPVRLNLNLH